MIYGQILTSRDMHELQSLKNLFLIGLVNSRECTSFDFAIAHVFQQIEKINESYSKGDCGFKVEVEYFVGDTLASQAFGGFIESPGSANYPCRECMVHKTQISSFY